MPGHTYEAKGESKQQWKLVNSIKLAVNTLGGAIILINIMHTIS